METYKIYSYDIKIKAFHLYIDFRSEWFYVFQFRITWFRNLGMNGERLTDDRTMGMQSPFENMTENDTFMFFEVELLSSGQVPCEFVSILEQIFL